MATKFDDVKAGDYIIADGTHQCLKPGAVRVVHADDGRQSNMHVMCDRAPEKHCLCADADGNLIGFQKMREQHGARAVDEQLSNR